MLWADRKVRNICFKDIAYSEIISTYCVRTGLWHFHCSMQCWEECWKNLDFGRCFCYSFYSKYLCIFILFHCVVHENFQFSNLFLWWTKPPKMRIILLTDGPYFRSVNYYTAKKSNCCQLIRWIQGQSLGSDTK